MGFLTKVWTALRGVGHETEGVFIDAQGIRILEQEVRDAKEAQVDAKESLTDVMAEQLKMERQVDLTRKNLAEYDQAIRKLLAQNNEALATETAEKIAEIEVDLETEEMVLTSYNEQITDLKVTILESDKQIKALEREISIVKSTEAAQKAAELTAKRFSGSNSSLQSASDSLQRIKERQQKRKDKMLSARQLLKETSGTDLQDKLITAGVIHNKANGQSILERYKAAENKTT
ncbi:MAG: PspA/IM30 family protein [Gammaproteobacteria bacterium]|nr:PspA/IM30 family protein [Gammaproteobacteria bacterium]